MSETTAENNFFSIKKTITSIDDIYVKKYNKEISFKTRLFVFILCLLYLSCKNKNEGSNNSESIEKKYYYFLNQDTHSEIIDYLFEGKKYSEIKIDTNFAKEYFTKIEKYELDEKYESINDDVIENLLEYSLSPNGFVKTNYNDNEMKEYYEKIHFLNLDNNNHLSSKNIEKWISINPENKFHYTLILNSVLETYKIALNSEIKKLARQKIENYKKTENEKTINKVNELNKILEVLEEVKNIDKLLEIKSEVNKYNATEVNDVTYVTEEKKLFNKYKLKKLATIDILSNDLFDKILDGLRIENNSFENHKSIRKKYIQHRMFLILLLIFVSLFGASGIVFSAYEIIKEFCRLTK
ncbi:hypothetical protein [Mycoplasmopsis pullorum]|uniref:Uncharacterized protein n=1 Tax=Mycoplasmopsis pullorum TaxID=48003 RepID=A0A1L4FRC0_9BACT|nr:hypothetical protein [Mycoplasmopsis pullorum]APJ38154.1 hypothetical protein BLA55_00390 [Mycoplasmopsis pullorum]